MKLSQFTKDYFLSLQKHLESLDYKQLEKLVEVVWKAYQNSKQIFFIGNGGSASTATHLAADIGKNIGLPIKTISLCDNIAWITALGNDLSYEDIFVEQLKNFAKPKDVLIAISGSGNSANVVKAVKWANAAKLTTVGLLGFDGGKLMKLVKHSVLVPVKHYGFVEGIHSEVHHYLVESLKLLKNGKNIH
jgi:D-sedoheptulose 7-phosphate isomerase